MSDSEWSSDLRQLAAKMQAIKERIVREEDADVDIDEDDIVALSAAADALDAASRVLAPERTATGDCMQCRCGCPVMYVDAEREAERATIHLTCARCGKAGALSLEAETTTKVTQPEFVWPQQQGSFEPDPW